MTYSVYEGIKTIKDELHLRFKTKTDNGGLVMIETSDPNQFIKIIINNEVNVVNLQFNSNTFSCGSKIEIRNCFAYQFRLLN